MLLLAIILYAVNAQEGTITTVAGNGSLVAGGDGFAATSAGIPDPQDVAVDALGYLYVTSQGRVRRVAPDGRIETFAILPLPTIAGYSVPSQTSASGLAFDSSSNLFVSQVSSLGGRVLKVDQSGKATVLTSGVPHFSIEALFGYVGVATSSSGTVYVADAPDHTVRAIVCSSSACSSVFEAGRSRLNAFGGDGGLAKLASLNTPAGIAFDAAGNLFIADSGNHRIRRVDRDSLIITTVVGSGGPDGGFSGDGGPAVNARLNRPVGLAMDRLGNLYIADQGNRRIRRVDRNGIITTVAGSGVASDCFWDECYGGDNGPAVSAKLSGSIQGLSVDNGGNLYIADKGNNRVRKARLAPFARSPVIAAGGVVNAASYGGGGIAPGEIVSIYGSNLGPPIGVANSGYTADTGRLPTTLGGVSVSFDGQAAPLFYVASGQINAQVPYEVAGRSTSTVAVTFDGVTSGAISVPMVAAHPGVFVHGDRAIITDTLTGALITASNPIARGGFVTIWATGPGVVTPLPMTGAPASASPLCWATNPEAWIGGKPVQVQFAGMTPGLVGLLQINLQIPADAPSGAQVSLKLSINGILAQGYISGALTTDLTIAVR